MKTASTSKRRLMILSRDPKTADGGVAVFVAAEMRSLSSRIEASHFTIGRRNGESPLSTAWRLFVDPVRLYRRLGKFGPCTVQLNPSLNYRSLIRDFVFYKITQRFPQIKVVVVFHGWNSTIAKTIAANRLLRRLFRNSFGKSSLFVVLSPGFATEAMAMGTPESVIHVLTTMFDDYDLRQSDTRPNPNSKTVLFMARLIEEKGAADLVDAFARGHKSNWPDWNLVIAGDGPDRQNVADRVRAHNLNGSVILAGYVRGEQKRTLLNEAAIFALPTRYNEGVPISVMEAMSVGCSLLTSRAGGLGYVVDEDDGVVMDESTPDNIFAGLKRLITDDEYRRATQIHCHEHAWSRLSSTHVIGELETLINNIENQPETTRSD